MNATEAEALAELYDAHGVIARHLADVLDLLRAIDQGLPPVDLANALHAVEHHVEKSYEAAAAERRRWAP